jgi:hypothetical protein
MWMTGFNLSDCLDADSMGFNENKCALVFNEKLGVMKQMLDRIDSVSCTSDFIREDFFGGMEPGTKKSNGSKLQTTRAAKKPRTPANPPGKGNTVVPLVNVACQGWDCGGGEAGNT